MADDNTNVVDVSREYYNSDDADNFYFNIWGGEDIHIGLYQNDAEPIAEASRRTVERMADKLAHLPASAHILDIGAGYGGSARWLARNKGHRVTALNLSEVQNQRDRQMNEAQGLSDQIDVIDGDFENLPFKDATFDAVWCQDSILHSGNRKRVFEEVNRVLKPGGHFVFTDPMEKGGVPREQLQPVLDRIHLESMGSIDVYKSYADDLGWETVEIEELHEYLPKHYARVLRELEDRDAEVVNFCSRDYIERMKTGLRNWVKAGSEGALAWGILHFRKPTA